MNATILALTSTHRPWLRTALYARLQDEEAVDEVLQETAIAALRMPAPLADETRMGPWLYRVAVRQAALYRRSKGRERKKRDGYRRKLEASAASDYGCDPSSRAIATERTRSVRDAVASLPRRDREILMLKYSEDFSYREIGERLGLSVSAVEARLHRARGRLRTLLKDA